ncbi:hypothetical protein NUW54_g8515 [Trametes sanguinea]|uniref:Uncharacterized protein n=1 Tax=Trametes sanguinea TaxID=158606 RepID=A0ACC1PFY3_9APHY|nr:hypothetical protein NUW54_g8515 [Trametes sanguinea]
MSLQPYPLTLPKLPAAWSRNLSFAIRRNSVAILLSDTVRRAKDCNYIHASPASIQGDLNMPPMLGSGSNAGFDNQPQFATASPVWSSLSPMTNNSDQPNYQWGSSSTTNWPDCPDGLEGMSGQPSRFGEVQYFFLMDIQGTTHALAMIAPFSAPDPTILAESENTVIACTAPVASDREVIKVSAISSVVAMVPLPPKPSEQSALGDAGSMRFFVVEKPGLDVAVLSGLEQDNVDHEGDKED